MSRPFVIVDGSNFIFRAFYALQQGRPDGRNIALSTSYGMPTGALNVFSAMLMRIYLDEKPDYVVVVFDEGGSTFRKELDPGYKANRKEVPDDLKPQFPWFEKIVRAFHMPVIREPSVEADDVIASLARRARARGLEVLIFTGDKDLMQLVDDRVKVVDTMRDVVYHAAAVEEKFGVPPKLVGEWLALRGDTSDNVPGVAGIGDVTATKLLREFGSIDAILAGVGKLKGKMQEKFRAPETLAALELSRKLVTLRDDVAAAEEPEAYRRRDWDARELAEIFRTLEFNKFLSRLEALFISDRERYLTILDEDALDKLIAAARAAGEVAISTHASGPDPVRAAVIGIGVATAGQPAAYIPLGHRYLGAPKQLDARSVIARLKPLLEDPAVKKYLHDSKDEGVRLRRLGVELAGVRCDPQLASYLLDPSHPQHQLELVAKAILDHACLTLDQVCGKGKEAKPFDQVDVIVAAPYGAECSDVALALGKVLRTRIDGAGLGQHHDEVELPLARVLGRMEEHGIKVDLRVLERLGEKLGEELGRLERRIHELANYPINPGSPKQLSELLFDKLGLRSDKMRRTKTGVFSTDAEQLEELVDQHEIVKPILEHRELFKLKGTYLDSLPAFINPETGRVHTSYSQVIASTGRIASNNPNLQNIPIRTAIGREIRGAFVAEPGWTLVSADYSQIELRVLAHLSGDTTLTDAFARDLDVHGQTAAEVFGVPLDLVSSEMRRVAKAVNYGLGYGQSDFGLARVLDIPRDEARRYIEIYFARFAGIGSFMEQTIADAHKTQQTRTLAGRRIPIPGISSSRYQDRAAAERFARNAPIQGSAADILKSAMLRVQRVIDEGPWKARMLLTVHDELVFEVPKEQAGDFAAVARREMENAWQLRVPLKVDVGVAESWADAH